MNSNLKTFDLSFGDPVCVRDSLISLYTIPLNLIKLNEISYPDPIGHSDLIGELVSRKDLADNSNVVLTTGASQAINIILRILKKEGKNTISKNTPCYMYYDDIIDRSGLVREDQWSDKTDVVLYDWPSNPEGLTNDRWKDFKKDFIWDSVYNTPTYVNVVAPSEPVGWRFRIGGFSKLVGLSGLRIGWIVCRDKKDMEVVSHELKYENCGISSVSQVIAMDIMKKLDFDLFFKNSNMRINMNREEVSKISKLFDGQDLPVNGMFYPVTANKKSISILIKAGIKYITLAEGKEPLIRFSLGQDNTLTKDAVKAILTADRIRSRK